MDRQTISIPGLGTERGNRLLPPSQWLRLEMGNGRRWRQNQIPQSPSASNPAEQPRNTRASTKSAAGKASPGKDGVRVTSRFTRLRLSRSTSLSCMARLVRLVSFSSQMHLHSFVSCFEPNRLVEFLCFGASLVCGELNQMTSFPFGAYLYLFEHQSSDSQRTV